MSGASRGGGKFVNLRGRQRFPRRDKPGRYDAAASGHNVVHWSPYQGMDLTYRPAATFLRGKMIFDGKDVTPPGQGRFVRPARAGHLS